MASLAANLEHADVFAKFVTEGELSTEDQLRVSFMYALDLRNREFERIVDPQFAVLVDELLADAPPDDTYRRMASWADDRMDGKIRAPNEPVTQN